MGCGEKVNTSHFDCDICGFESHQPSYVLLAQLVEHTTFNRGVTGSSPVWHIAILIVKIIKNKGDIIMGIIAKDFGKKKSIIVKVQNRIEKEKAAIITNKRDKKTKK